VRNITVVHKFYHLFIIILLNLLGFWHLDLYFKTLLKIFFKTFVHSSFLSNFGNCLILLSECAQQTVEKYRYVLISTNHPQLLSFYFFQLVAFPWSKISSEMWLYNVFSSFFFKVFLKLFLLLISNMPLTPFNQISYQPFHVIDYLPLGTM